MNNAISIAVIVGSLLAGALSPVRAQDVQTEAADARSQLEARKHEKAAQFDAQERACATVFAVTDCVGAVNARRREVLAALRKEENGLNDAERHQRERERLQSLQTKVRGRELSEQASAPVGPATDSEGQRLRRQQDKQANHAPQSAPKPQTTAKVRLPIDALTRQENATAYAARQQAASDRRTARDKKLKEKRAADLPVPP